MLFIYARWVYIYAERKAAARKIFKPNLHHRKRFLGMNPQLYAFALSGRTTHTSRGDKGEHSCSCKNVTALPPSGGKRRDALLRAPPPFTEGLRGVLRKS
jgi:hypothetical protein